MDVYNCLFPDIAFLVLCICLCLIRNIACFVLCICLCLIRNIACFVLCICPCLIRNIAYHIFCIFSCLSESSGTPLGFLLKTVGVPGALLGDPWQQNVSKRRTFSRAGFSRALGEAKGSRGTSKCHQNLTKMKSNGDPRNFKSHENCWEYGYHFSLFLSARGSKSRENGWEYGSHFSLFFLFSLFSLCSLFSLF